MFNLPRSPLGACIQQALRIGRGIAPLALCCTIVMELSACGGQSEYFNAPIGTFVAGPNSYKGKLLPPVDLSFAGLYSVPRTVTLYNSTQTTTEQDYLYVSATGVITTFVYQDAGNFPTSRNCYLPASGSEPNARLQNLQLYEPSDQSGNI